MHSLSKSLRISRPQHRPDPVPGQPGHAPDASPQADDLPGVPADTPADVPLRDDPADRPLE